MTAQPAERHRLAILNDEIAARERSLADLRKRSADPSQPCTSVSARRAIIAASEAVIADLRAERERITRQADAPSKPRLGAEAAPPLPMCARLPALAAVDPAAIDAISTAFERACADLRVFAEDQRGQEIVAARIILLARNGVTDPAALHQRVVAEARVSL